MFGTDEDEDFIPASGSKLASLFGKVSEEGGNATLTYVAPKQPKKNRSETQVPAFKTSIEQPKLGLIIAKAVQTYKLENGNYNSQGKLGAAVLGNVETRVFQLLLYKNKQLHVTSAKIAENFQFTVQPNKFASFYDDQRQNWSIMFDTEEDGIEFAKQICLVRANAFEVGEQPFYVQDLRLGEGFVAEVSDLLEIRYTTSLLSGCSLGQAIETNLDADRPQQVKIRKGVWEEALIGANKGCKKLIVLAPELFGPWKPMAPPNVRLTVEVEVGRIKSNRKFRETTPPINMFRGDSSESNVDSSTDDTSIKARGASISEALTNSPKTHKASIISRMARMGQATLPLKGSLVCNPSDSEETEEDCSGSSHIAKPVAKSRSAVLKSRTTCQENLGSSSTTNNSGSSKQHLTVLQTMPTSGSTSTSWQQQQQPTTQILHNGMAFAIPPQYGQFSTVMTQPGMASNQLFPAQSATVATPTSIHSPDTHLSMVLSENRAQNMEVRMGVSKVIDKVDQVMVKLDSLSQQRPAGAVGTLEPMALLASVQKLITDNELLQAELCDKRAKLEQQNDKMYRLLNSNHKYLEQQEQQHQELPLQAMVLTLQQEKVKLTADLNDALSNASTLQSQNINFEKGVIDLNEEVNRMTAQLHRQLTELESHKTTILEQETCLHNLEERLHASTQQHQLQESNIEELTATKLALEKHLAEAHQHLEMKCLAASKQMSALVVSHQEQLEALQSQLRSRNLFISAESDEMKDLKHSLTNQEEKYKQALEKMEQDQEYLRNKVHMLEGQLKSDDTAKQTDHTTAVEDVKKVMNVMFRLLKNEFELEKLYKGADIVQILLSTIKDVTLQYVKMRASSENQPSIKKQNLPQHVESDKESPASNITTINNGLDSSHPPGHESLIPSDKHTTQASSNTATHQNKVKSIDPEVQMLYESKATDLDTEHSLKHVTNKQEERLLHSVQVSNGSRDSPLERLRGSDLMNQSNMSELNLVDLESDQKQQSQNVPKEKSKNAVSTESNVHSNKADSESVQATHQSRESSLERGWRPQPPPPPLFDDEDDDDDWLS